MTRLVAVALAAYCFGTNTYAFNPAQAGKPFLGKPPHVRPHSIPRPIITSLATCTRRTLAVSDDVQWNIDGLLRQGVTEHRISELQELALKQRYASIPGRGDFALLECLKVRTCDLDTFPDLATSVGQNQLHLQHAARCAGCNKINVFKLSGNTVEGMMHSFYARGGWRHLPGEIGNSGIDGLYYKTDSSGRVVDILVTEAKYNESILQETRSGTQMSKQWILDNLARLDARATLDNKLEDVRRYREVSRLVESDNYRAQIWHMNVADDRLSIWREQITSRGRSIDRRDRITSEAPWNPGNVHEIDMLNPASDFDRQLLGDYTSVMSRTLVTGTE